MQRTNPVDNVREVRLDHVEGVVLSVGRRRATAHIVEPTNRRHHHLINDLLFLPISTIESAVGKRLITHCCVSLLACSRLSGHIEPHSPDFKREINTTIRLATLVYSIVDCGVTITSTTSSVVYRSTDTWLGLQLRGYCSSCVDRWRRSQIPVNCA